MTNKRNARIAGLLFLVATVTFMIGNGLIESISAEDEFLTALNANTLVTGVLLELVNATAVIGIAAFLYPILKQHHEPIAIGYVGFRVVEAAVLIAGSMLVLLLLPLSEAAASANLQTLATLFVEGHAMGFQLAMLVLGVGSLLLCGLLYRTRLVPRWLGVVGVMGYLLLMVNAVMELAGISAGSLLFIPGAIFEIIFPLWLIFKGMGDETPLPRPTVARQAG